MDFPTETTPPASGNEISNSALPPRRPGVWSGIGTVALYFLLQFTLGMLVSALIGLVLGIEAGIRAAQAHRKLDIHAIVGVMQQSPDMRAMLAVLTIAAATAVMILIVRRTWPAQWSRPELPGFGLVRPVHNGAFLGAVLLGITVLLLGGAITHLLAGTQPLDQDITAMAANVPVGLRILLAAMAVCVAPFAEELVFRGVLLSGLASRMRVGWAILVSALIFGCAHLPDFDFAWYAIPTLVLLGLALGWTRIKTRSLWPAVVMHATNNFVAVLAWFAIASR